LGTVALLQALQQRLELAPLGRAVGFGALDEARRQAEPRPDGERVALPRPVVDQPEGRLQP